MFSRKLTAILLLVLYGVPSALGPHWHHHHGASVDGVACAGHHHSHTNRAAPADACHATSHCCDHNHASVDSNQAQANQAQANKARPDKAQPSKAKRPTVVTSAEHAGPCAICAFYASAQCSAPPALSLDLSEAVEAVVIDGHSADSALCSVWQARGPPTL